MEVRLEIDGDEIELNEFVKKILGKTLEGMISTLKGVKSDWKILKIEVVR
ncbi:MAG: hypothetical protein NZ895_00765 [Archaeoglobaceae archaeon]|nr:hypothetical protein [Archaeoglobaceae archaeon]MCX8151951.1 hypothetical protein [Archaeoglobaceae archaeon]MDW8013340.1 hypothetical protein [Archaeoglobaceae archaeon]